MDDERKQVFFGTKKFEFPNGDIYSGEYCAHISGVIWREGTGKYRTADGHIYICNWKYDKINEKEDVDIRFPQGCQYLGKIRSNYFDGPGIYKVGKLSFLCNFQDNRPVGNMVMVDSDYVIWKGVAEHNSCLLKQEHIYWRSLSKIAGIGNAPDVSESSTPSYSLDSTVSVETNPRIRQSRLKKRRESSLNPWYRDYMTFRKKYTEILSKLQIKGVDELAAADRVWLEKYMAFRKKYREIMAKKKDPRVAVDNKLLEMYLDERYKVDYVMKICPTEKESEEYLSEDMEEEENEFDFNSYFSEASEFDNVRQYLAPKKS